MTYSMNIAQTTRFFVCAVAFVGGLAASVESASARDPRPTTYKMRARHDFRDVQLGLCHPANGNGKSVKCSEASNKPKTPPKK